MFSSPLASAWRQDWKGAGVEVGNYQTSADKPGCWWGLLGQWGKKQETGGACSPPPWCFFLKVKELSLAFSQAWPLGGHHSPRRGLTFSEVHICEQIRSPGPSPWYSCEPSQVTATLSACPPTDTQPHVPAHSGSCSETPTQPGGWGLNPVSLTG